MNWIKFNWGENTTIWDYNPINPFIIDLSDIGNISNDISPLDASLEAIKSITEQYPPPYYLFLSGGIDSQAMLYAWIKSGVPFDPISFVYNNNYNSHDLFNLAVIAEKFKVKVNYLHLDYFYFLEHELLDYCKTYVCNSPQITFHIKLSQTIGEGTHIFSGNPLNLTSDTPGGLDYTILGLYRYKLKTYPNIVPFFFCQTPELISSFHKTYITSTTQTARNLMIKKYDLKNLLYLDSGFDIVPTKKYTGFEKFKNFYDGVDLNLNFVDKLKYSRYPSKRNYDLQFRYKLFEINKYSTQVKWIIPSLLL